MNPKDEKLERENLEAFEKLLDEKESLDKMDINRYRYYKDMYNNEYRWTTHRQEDGKFHAVFFKALINNGWGRLTKIKERAFVRRNTAKAYCLKAYIKAKTHQKIVISAREARKQARLDAKPKLTKEELTFKKIENDIVHYNRLITKTNTKIKALTTRKKTYERRMKSLEKRHLKLVGAHL